MYIHVHRIPNKTYAMGPELYICTVDHIKVPFNLSHTQVQHRNNDIELTPRLNIFKEGE